MDHVVIPVGPDHRRAIDSLAAGAAAAAGVAPPAGGSDRHISLLAYEGLARDQAAPALLAAARHLGPLMVHAHGYGFFTGEQPSALTLHVPVVRGPALDLLHARLWAALGDAGAEIAPWSAPDLWSPHLTLLDRTLDPHTLGAAAAWLARRYHPSWNIPVDGILLTGGWPDTGGVPIPLGIAGS